MSSLYIGQILLNQFRADAFVASGGMGAVYRVWDLKRNVPLAMKVLHGDLAEDPSVFKRFKREANALKKLTHPNIVPFYGLYEASGFAFLLERYIDGPTLKDILRMHQGKPLPVYEVVTYLKALTAALGYAHANGVVHCDVKPGNIMIDQGGNIYLTDFGIARHSESTTTTLGTAGTPAYMAPEQIRGAPVSPATDVYALGVMLFEMLTGQRPFRGDEKGTESAGQTAGERIRFGHLAIAPPDPRLLNPTIPKSLAQVILKALEKDPFDRYQNTRDLFFATCNATETDPESLADRVGPPPKPIPVSNDQTSGIARNTAELVPSSSGPSIVQPKKRQIAWMVIGAGILVVVFAIVGIRSIGGGIGQTPSTMVGVLSTGTTIGAPQAIATIPPLPTSSPLPIPTLTPLPMPTITSSPTPNGDQPWGKIVFTCQVYDDPNRNQVCIINADGSGWRQLTDISRNYYASMAPDGRSVIFVSFRTGHWEIYEFNLENNSTTQLTFENSEFSGPEISPDGRTIIAARNLDNRAGIWMMNRDGGNLHPVIDLGVDCLDPTWSPDGKRILFACGDDPEYRHLMIMNSDGTSVHQVNEKFSTRGRSDWSSNGTTIVGYSQLSPNRELFTMYIDGTNLTQITHGWTDPALNYGNSQGPSFSPDGYWVTFTAYPDKDKVSSASPFCEIYISRVDGTGVRRLTQNSYCDYQPRWGP